MNKKKTVSRPFYEISFYFPFYSLFLFYIMFGVFSSAQLIPEALNWTVKRLRLQINELTSKQRAICDSRQTKSTKLIDVPQTHIAHILLLLGTLSSIQYLGRCDFTKRIKLLFKEVHFTNPVPWMPVQRGNEHQFIKLFFAHSKSVLGQHQKREEKQNAQKLNKIWKKMKINSRTF